MAAHGLQHQRALSRPAEVIRDVQMQLHQPLQPRLRQPGDPRAHQMLAQEHTEHGRLRRIVPQLRRELDAGIVGPRVEQQAHAAPQQQDHLIPRGLLHPVDAQAQKLRAQLLHHRL